MNKKVIYTAITGGYDALMQPKVIDPSFDYICFSDDVTQSERGVWKMLPIPFECENHTRLARYVKLLPHIVLKDYDISVWLDANIRIEDEAFYKVIDEKINEGCLIAQVPHLLRDCTYEEIAACYKDERISFADAMKQRKHIQEEGLPRHYGLFESNLIFRRHNDPLVVRVSEGWWQELSAYSCRDQLSLMPVLKKYGVSPELLFGEDFNTRNVGCLSVIKHSGPQDVSKIVGLPRLKKKFQWTWKKIVAHFFFS